MRYNIAIDGPAGAGKSTIAKKLAKELGHVPGHGILFYPKGCGQG